MQSKAIVWGRCLIAAALLALISADVLAQRGGGRGGDAGGRGGDTGRGSGGLQSSSTQPARGGFRDDGASGSMQRDTGILQRDSGAATSGGRWQGAGDRNGFSGARESRYWGSGRDWGRGRDDWSDRNRGDWDRGWGWSPGIGWRGRYGWPGYGYGYGEYSDSSGYYGPMYGYDQGYAAAPAYSPDDVGDQIDYMDRAVTAFQQGHFRAALRMASHAEVDNPQDPHIHLLAALSMFALGDYRGAAMEAHAVAASGQLPDWDVVYSFYDDIQPYTNQLRALEKFVRSNPAAPEGRFLLGFLYLITEYREAAARELLAAVKQAPRDRLATQLLQQAGGTVPADIAAQQQAQRPAPGEQRQPDQQRQQGQIQGPAPGEMQQQNQSQPRQGQQRTPEEQQRPPHGISPEPGR